MVLVDTSVWVDHLRRGSRRLSGLLNDSQVLGHPFVIGELACGRLTRRDEILGHLGALPAAEEARHHEVLTFIDAHGLAGWGVGWVDVHLLASTMLSRVSLWTLDRRLARAANELGVAFGR